MLPKAFKVVSKKLQNIDIRTLGFESTHANTLLAFLIFKEKKKLHLFKCFTKGPHNRFQGF